MTAIEAKLHLGQIPHQVLCTDFVPAPDDAALEQRKRVFDGIGMYSSLNVASAGVVDGLVLPAIVTHERMSVDRFRVDGAVIGHNDLNFSRDILPDIPLDGAALHVFGLKEAQIASPLPNA